MPTVDTYHAQTEYFANNKERMLVKYARNHEDYVALYDEVLSRLHTKQQRDGVALALLLRAAVYTNTAHNIALEGHVEEARILFRNPIELTLIAFLVLNSDDVWNLWEECHNKRFQHTDDNGLVMIQDFKEKRFNVNNIVKSHGKPFASDPLFDDLKRLRGEFSTYFSHENLYNVVARLETTEGKTKIYIGNDAGSENNRMDKVLSMTTHIMGIINDLSKQLKR